MKVMNMWHLSVELQRSVYVLPIFHYVRSMNLHIDTSFAYRTILQPHRTDINWYIRCKERVK